MKCTCDIVYYYLHVGTQHCHRPRDGATEHEGWEGVWVGLSFGMSSEGGGNQSYTNFRSIQVAWKFREIVEGHPKRTVQPKSRGRFRSRKDHRLALQPLGRLSRRNKRFRANLCPLHTGGNAGGGRLSNLQAGVRRKLGISVIVWQTTFAQQ